MITFIFTLSILLLVVTGMAIGVIVQNKPIKGSCGGMSSLGIDTACDICGGDTKKCEEEQKRQEEGGSHSSKNTSYLSYDATKK